MQQLAGLTSESVEGAALPLEGVDDVHGSHGLPLGVLSVGDSIPDDILKESGDCGILWRIFCQTGTFRGIFSIYQ